MKRLLQKYEKEWEACRGFPQGPLLQLNLLRELQQKLHTEKSKKLATHAPKSALFLDRLEERLERLKEGTNFDLPLRDLLKSDPPSQQFSSTLSLTGPLLEKLQRGDRRWEFCLAAQALQLHWTFWTLDAWVGIQTIEAWNDALHQALWPRAVILFAEHRSQSDSKLWHGRWYLAIQPEMTNPSLDYSILAHWKAYPKGESYLPIWERYLG